MLHTEELAEAARTAITDYESKYGELRPVSDNTLEEWAKYAKPKLDEMIAQQFEVYATHPDFLTADQQEQAHLDINTEAVSVLVDGLITQIVKIS